MNDLYYLSIKCYWFRNFYKLSKKISMVSKVNKNRHIRKNTQKYTSPIQLFQNTKIISFQNFNLSISVKKTSLFPTHQPTASPGKFRNNCLNIGL